MPDAPPHQRGHQFNQTVPRRSCPISGRMWRIPNCRLSQVAQRRWPNRIVVNPYTLSTYEHVRPGRIHEIFTLVGTRRPQLQVLGGRTVDTPPAEALGWKPQVARRGLSPRTVSRFTHAFLLETGQHFAAWASKSRTIAREFPVPGAAAFSGAETEDSGGSRTTSVY